MIGKLKKFSVRDRYDKKVARVSVDIPLNQMTGREVDEQAIEDFLRNNVGSEIGFNVDALTDTEQEAIDEQSDKEGPEAPGEIADEMDF